MHDSPVRRVLMTADTVGGVWTYALELCRAHESLGVEVLLATMGELPSSAQLMEASEIRLECSRFQLEWMPNAWSGVDEAGRWLLHLAREFQPDLVHLNGYVHAALVWNAPVLVVAHSCVMSWWQAVKGESAPAEWDEYRRRVTAGLKHADFVIAPSQWMLDQIKQHYGEPKAIAIIPNGINSGGCFKRKQPFVFTAGRLWDEGKNLQLLVEAAGKIEWPVVVAGDSKASTNGVNHLGRLSQQDVHQRMCDAAIYCHPAKYEPFGLAPLEAAARGCALVLGDIPSLRGIWGDAAVYVSTHDALDLAQKVNELVNDEYRRAKMASRAQSRASEMNSAAMAKAYLHRYQTLVHEVATA